MNFYVASCCTFCPSASCAFATSDYSPIATVPNCWSCAVLICRRVHPHRSQVALGISVNTAVAARCEWLRHSLPLNFLPGPMHLNRRTLHDPSPLSFDAIHVAVYAALPVSVEPDVCANSPTMATHVLSFSYDRLSRSIRDDHHCSLTQVALSSQQLIPTLPPHPATPISDSKHIIPVGGLDQPTLSLVLRPRRF